MPIKLPRLALLSKSVACGVLWDTRLIRIDTGEGVGVLFGNSNGRRGKHRGRSKDESKNGVVTLKVDKVKL